MENLAIRLTVDSMPSLIIQEQDALPMTLGGLSATIDREYCSQVWVVSTALNSKEGSDMTHGSVLLSCVVSGRDCFQADSVDNAQTTWRAEDSIAFKLCASQTNS